MLPSQYLESNRGRGAAGSGNQSQSHKTNTTLNGTTKKDGHARAAAKDLTEGGAVTAAMKKLSKTARHGSQIKQTVQNLQNEEPVATSTEVASVSSETGSPIPSKRTTSATPLIEVAETPPTEPSSCEDKAGAFGWDAKEHAEIFASEHAVLFAPPESPTTRTQDSPQPPEVDIPWPESTKPKRKPSVAVQKKYEPDTYISERTEAERKASIATQRRDDHRNTSLSPAPQYVKAQYPASADEMMQAPYRVDMRSTEHAHFHGFDILPCGWSGRGGRENVVLQGYSGVVSAIGVGGRGLSRTIKIEGLRGGVHGAKVIPRIWEGQIDELMLVVLLIHGAYPDHTARSTDQHSKPHGLELHSDRQNPSGLFQTTVEVWSLRKRQHVKTLLKLPPQPSVFSRSGMVTPPPPEVLTLLADGRTLIISSSRSGETWIFGVETEQNKVDFRCVAKVWTSIQAGFSNAAEQADLPWSMADHTPRKPPRKSPIVALKGRYLAYCPPAPSSVAAIKAEIISDTSTAKLPGLSTLTAPNIPAVNCAAFTDEAGGLLHAVTQQALNGLVKGADLVTGLTKSAVNSYLQQSNPQDLDHQQGGSRSPPEQFPPTHGIQAPAPTTRSPGLVSIIDLTRLSDHDKSSIAPVPIATFRTSCSYISFSPDGLHLFTVNSKGTTQRLWDLKCIRGGMKSIGADAQQLGPHVRQVMKFARMTNASVVDVAWAVPTGDRILMVTEHETVHVLDVPAASMAWPAARLKRPAGKQVDSERQGGVGNTMTHLMKTASPYFSRSRRRSSTSGPVLTAANIKAQAGYGTQTLVKAITQSVGPAIGKVNELYQTANNKLHLPRHATSSRAPAPGCVRLVSGKKRDHVYVLGAGTLGIYTIGSRSSAHATDHSTKKSASATAASKYRDYKLPSAPAKVNSPLFLQYLEQDEDEEELPSPSHEPELRLSQQRKALQAVAIEDAIPRAEIETNAPYQPFHTDGRVSLNTICASAPGPASSPTVSILLTTSLPAGAGAQSRIAGSNIIPQPSAWCFGNAILATKLNLGSPTSSPTASRTTDGEGFFEDDCEVLDFSG